MQKWAKVSSCWLEWKLNCQDMICKIFVLAFLCKKEKILLFWCRASDFSRSHISIWTRGAYRKSHTCAKMWKHINRQEVDQRKEIQARGIFGVGWLTRKRSARSESSSVISTIIFPLNNSEFIIPWISIATEVTLAYKLRQLPS